MPTIASVQGDTLHVVALGTNGQLWYCAGTVDDYWDCNPTGFTGLTGTPAVADGADGSVHAFAVGSDGQLRHFWHDHAGWHEAAQVATGLAPTACPMHAYRIDSDY